MSNFVILIVNVGFLFFLCIVSLWFISLRISNKSSNLELEQRLLISQIGKVILIVSYSIVALIVLISLFLGVSIKDDNDDISNWVTLIVEIGLGVIFGLSVFIYSNKEQKKTKKILEDQLDKSKKRNEYVMKQIRYKLSFASDISPTAQNLEDAILIENEDDREYAIHEELHNLPYAIDELNNVQNLTNLYADDIEPEDIKLILNVAKTAQNMSRFLENEPDTLRNVLETFEKHGAIFFEKYPPINWSENQEEALD